MNFLRVALTLALILAFATPEGLDSCAIAPAVPVFINYQGPPNQREFLDGKLGVLRPSFEARHQIAAFRTLSGVPLTQAEKDSLYDDQRDVGSFAGYPPQMWIQARETVGIGRAPEINQYGALRRNGLVLYFENCKNDAFLTAKATLEELTDSWGKNDPRLIEWIGAQDQVFSNCPGTTANIPAPPKPDVDPLLAAHRQYQIAAALFYAGQFHNAAAAFDKIALDGDSPWRGWAPYLAGRALLRAGLIDGDMDAFREGETRLLAIAGDPQLEEWQEPAKKLIELWRIRVEPLKRVSDLNRQLMMPNSEDISQSVIDLVYLVRTRIYGGVRSWSTEEISEVEKNSELAGWLLCMSSQPPADAGERAVEWWRKGHRPAWLIAALINGGDQDMPELFAAVDGLSPASPEFESATYHAAVRAAKLRQYDLATKLADRALRQKLETTTRNSFLQIRLRLARTFQEFLRFATRQADPSLILYEEHEIEASSGDTHLPDAPVFDLDATDDFNIQLPLGLWLQASTSPMLSTELKLRIAETGWMRSMILGRSDEAKKFLERTVALNPGAASIASNYLNARDAKEADFGAVYIALKTPGLAPALEAGAILPNLSRPRNHYTNGGWYVYSWTNENSARRASTSPLRFLSTADRTAAAAEWSKIHASTPWGATYLLRETLEWSQSHPDDKRVPEALHRAIMASFFRRDGQEDMGKYSKRAWEMLHQRFPKSEWAVRTQYWYK